MKNNQGVAVLYLGLMVLLTGGQNVKLFSVKDLSKNHHHIYDGSITCEKIVGAGYG